MYLLEPTEWSSLCRRALVYVTNFVPLRTQSSGPIFHYGMRLLAWLLSLPLDSLFSPPGRLCLRPNPSLLYPTLWISVYSRWWRTLRELITGWICLPPFHSPLLSFWPPLSPAYFFSSLYNSVNISERSSCGVHIYLLCSWFYIYCNSFHPWPTQNW